MSSRSLLTRSPRRFAPRDNEKEYATRIMSDPRIAACIDRIYSYYRSHKRLFPWRDTENTYHVYLSEVMLQQTQTGRVREKFAEFLSVLPTWQALATAPLSAVLSLWQGLGYNRRAKFLHESAQRIVRDHEGTVPSDIETLESLPGIGPATARSIAAFAYNKPVVFIETNIRTVFIHEFFPGEREVSDADLLPFIEATLDRDNPRQWYYALMDYGVMLKQTLPNPSRRSKHHVVQSRFEGSDRQIRGACIRALTQTLMPSSRGAQHRDDRYHRQHEAEGRGDPERDSLFRLSDAELIALVAAELPHASHERIERILHDLISEGMVVWQDGTVGLPD